MGLTKTEREKLKELQEKIDEPHTFLTEKEIEKYEVESIEIYREVRSLNYLEQVNNLWIKLLDALYHLSDINLRLVDEVRKLREEKQEKD